RISSAMTRASFGRPELGNYSLANKKGGSDVAIRCSWFVPFPALPALDAYWIGGIVPAQGPTAIPAATGGLTERTTASSNEQSDLTPVELNVNGLDATW